MTYPSDTHHRAALRGREGVARCRLRGAVWAGRLYTIAFVIYSIAPLLNREGPDWISAAVLLVAALGMAVATIYVGRGSRIAASALLGWFVLTKLASWLLAGQPLWHGAIWTLIIGGALVNGVWGAIELTRVMRETAMVPPAPARARVQRAAI
ncbi:MAG: hypothetical protein ACXW0Z_04470 [Gemmatirosa sp.]